MPLQDYMRLVSVDDHAIEPADVWTNRVPAKYGDAVPHVEERDFEQGVQLGRNAHGLHQVWMYEGEMYADIGLNAVAGKDPSEWDTEPARFEDMRPGCFDPVERVKDMDIDGVQAQLCFPSFPRFAGTRFLPAKDKELALLCVQAWNDWMLDDWCGAAPDRFVPFGILPLWDPTLARDEATRIIGKGCKAIGFPENPSPLGLPSFHTDHWDPVLAVVEEAGVPLCMHFGTSGVKPSVSPDAPTPVVISLMGSNSAAALADLLFAPTFHNFPNLKVSLAEGGIGWIPYQLERIDYVWERHRYYSGVRTDVRPSDLFRRNVWGCFIDDVHGIKSRHTIGVDRITWESDYPHSDSAWPHSRKRAEEVLADVPDEEAHRIVELNACEMFNWRPWAS
jgi:predicted TIM-barrel fold metal-dependent hydrolase